MLIVQRHFFVVICLLLFSFKGLTQQTKRPIDIVEQAFLNPPESAKPWVFWYWMHAAVSKEGITADLEAMKEVGIGGAYLMPIKDTSSAVPFQPVVRQLSPEWWEMVRFAMQEAKRLKLKLAMHVSDGFALAGGPWITPELSMQKLVWTKTYIKDGFTGNLKLEQPETNAGYYKDVTVLAYPANSSYAFSDEVMIPSVTTSNGANAEFLSFPDPDNKQSFRSDSACWIQYKYPQPFTCRSIRIHTGTNTYQAQRLIIQSSDDGINFKTVTRLNPPRHGWQDTDEDYTHAVPAISSKYFRFVYDKDGSEPGAEDLDAAKWRPSLRVMGIYLSDEPVINQYEAKNGSVWRVATGTTTEQVSDKDAVPLKSVINLSSKLGSDGKLNWSPPAGKTGWVVVRIGHTTTGQTNATGGAAKGLECDKFNTAAIKLQFDSWFGKAFEKTNPALAKEVLKVFHVDSWECGSQNWSKTFVAEFKKRRGYDLLPFLLVMTGVPVDNAAASERILHDVRTTIAELVNDIFYKTLNKLAHEKGCSFSAESIAPTFVSDGLLHYKNADIPMGEFWLNSPTHDKPNDMLDAISGAHIYGKNIIQAEAFTSVRMNWGEHPGNLKAIGDRNFALGINKMVLHVFTHNPWINRKPGMTLDGVGLYFQRDQTWFKQSKAWIEYLTRCQALLQLGTPVIDIAVFTGEEVPRRSVLPDRLINTLPGIFGKERVETEKKRLENIGQPLRTKPDGVTHSANMADPEDWIDPLNGYAYDSFNPDVLMAMRVVNGRVVTQGGASYKILIIPADAKMNPALQISIPSLKKILTLVKDGGTILIDSSYKKYLTIAGYKPGVGDKGKLIFTPYNDSSFENLGLGRDVELIDNDHSIAWTHRKIGDEDVYFLSNQGKGTKIEYWVFNVQGMIPHVYDPVNNTMKRAYQLYPSIGKTVINKYLSENESVFIVFKKPKSAMPWDEKMMTIADVKFKQKWSIAFDKNSGGPEHVIVVDSLYSWSKHSDHSVKYYSGTARYNNKFEWNIKDGYDAVILGFDSIYNIATVKINGISLDTLWTPPYMLYITKGFRDGTNNLEIEVSNTWANRLIGDQFLSPEKRITWTTAPFRLKDKPLLPAGIIGIRAIKVKYEKM